MTDVVEEVDAESDFSFWGLMSMVRIDQSVDLKIQEPPYAVGDETKYGVVEDYSNTELGYIYNTDQGLLTIIPEISQITDFYRDFSDSPFESEFVILREGSTDFISYEDMRRPIIDEI